MLLTDFIIDPDKLPTVDFLLKLAGGLGAIAIFKIGLTRYSREQTWKRLEFVAKEMKDFNSDPMARNAMYMIDWGERYIELFPGRANYEERFVKVDREIFKSALQYHKYRVNEDLSQERYSRTEVAIRDNMDTFLSYFERFHHFTEAKLITTDELKPYIRYWIVSISTLMEADVRAVFYEYIKNYNYTGTEQLFEAFGVTIAPRKHASATTS